MAYSAKVLDHYENPRNVGKLDKEDLQVGTGMSLDQATEIKNTELAQELSLPPVKIHCSVLAEDAIKAAVKDYRDRYSSD